MTFYTELFFETKHANLSKWCNIYAKHITFAENFPKTFEICKKGDYF